MILIYQYRWFIEITNLLSDGWESRLVAPTGSPLNREYVLERLIAQVRSFDSPHKNHIYHNG